MIEIIYQDAFLLVVNKPSNLIVHHSRYARNIEETSLVDLVKEAGFPDATPVHRLDRKTSGLILFAKEKQFVATFQTLFTEQKIEKKYHALLRGWTEQAGIINSPVKNDRGNYKDAITEFKTLKHFEKEFEIPPYAIQRYSLVEFSPKTGRMHQLRIHANKIAHPIINDPKYGNRHHNHYFQEQLNIQELFLHAAELVFLHPFLNTEIRLTSNIPNFWDIFLNI